MIDSLQPGMQDYLQPGDILQTETLFDSTKFLTYLVLKVHPIYSRPDSNGEIHFEKMRYLCKLQYVNYEKTFYLSHDDIGHDVWLHERKRADGLILQFKRPKALAKG